MLRTKGVKKFFILEYEEKVCKSLFIYEKENKESFPYDTKINNEKLVI